MDTCRQWPVVKRNKGNTLRLMCIQDCLRVAHEKHKKDDRIKFSAMVLDKFCTARSAAYHS